MYLNVSMLPVGLPRERKSSPYRSRMVNESQKEKHKEREFVSFSDLSDPAVGDMRAG